MPWNNICHFCDKPTYLVPAAILAIGVKEGNRLFIGGEEFEL